MAPQPPLDPGPPQALLPLILCLNSLFCIDSFGSDLWQLFSRALHHGHRNNIFSSICHCCHHYHHQSHHSHQPYYPPQRIAQKPGSGFQGPESPFPTVVSSKERPLHPFLTGRQVGTKNSLPPTYFQELKVSMFHVYCFDAVKRKLQFP